VQTSVAPVTKRDQVLFRVIPECAPRSNVVNLEILQRPTPLAAPTVALQYSLAKYSVQSRIPRDSEKRVHPFTLNVATLMAIDSSAIFASSSHSSNLLRQAGSRLFA